MCVAFVACVCVACVVRLFRFSSLWAWAVVKGGVWSFVQRKMSAPVEPSELAVVQI